jgi:hypothetical protein
MLRAPRSPIIAGLTLETIVHNPQFFDEGQISDQRQYELGLPSATVAVAAPPLRTVYMDAGTMELIPQARELPSYDDLLNNRDQLIAAMEQVAKDTEPDWPIAEQALAQPTYALPSPKRAKIERVPAHTRSIVRHSSPPTAPTIIQMVSAQPETSDGYNVNSPAYFVPSLSPSTTPESGQRRSATWSLLDATTQRRVSAESDNVDSNINPNPTHDPNRG